MSNDKLLTTKEINQRQSELPVEWTVVGGMNLTRVYKFSDFKEALGFVIKAGTVAEKLNHHPNIELSWGEVKIHISTHSAGGLTVNDFKLAHAVDKIL